MQAEGTLVMQICQASGLSGGCVRIQFWGTRGSIAKPDPSTARYGGNTPCVEVRSARDTLIVLDCGTGGHALGQELISAGAQGARGHILISHTHWDHIQGIPFFAPLFVPGNEWDIYGPKGLGQSLRCGQDSNGVAGLNRHLSRANDGELWQ
jgi:phosphoribosyl 1,2-cyclic phosphodiesterase